MLRHEVLYVSRGLLHRDEMNDLLKSYNSLNRDVHNNISSKYVTQDALSNIVLVTDKLTSKNRPCPQKREKKRKV
jgi:hypothetical protein